MALGLVIGHQLLKRRIEGLANVVGGKAEAASVAVLTL